MRLALADVQGIAEYYGLIYNGLYSPDLTVRAKSGKELELMWSEQEEAKLKQMLAETDDDSDDIREAKATMGLFATERYFTEKAPATKKPRKGWRRLKYAAVFALGVLLDLFLDIDNPYNTKR